MKPKQKTPELQLSLINDTQWSLDKQEAENYTLLVFYRGYHCPLCKKQLEEISENLEKFVDRGVHVIAISMDTEERAKKTGEEWDLKDLPVGYNLSKSQAKEWDLYLSESISDKEPELFSEPGLFLVQPDRSLFFSSIQTMPFARPKVDDIIKALDFIKKEDYPPRGEA